jgi:hypothetical protein
MTVINLRNDTAEDVIGMYQYAQSAHATIGSAITQPIAMLERFISYSYVSIVTLLTLTTEHRGRWHRPCYK